MLLCGFRLALHNNFHPKNSLILWQFSENSSTVAFVIDHIWSAFENDVRWRHANLDITVILNWVNFTATNILGMITGGCCYCYAIRAQWILFVSQSVCILNSCMCLFVCVCRVSLSCIVIKQMRNKLLCPKFTLIISV